MFLFVKSQSDKILIIARCLKNKLCKPFIICTKYAMGQQNNNTQPIAYTQTKLTIIEFHDI